MTTALVRKAAVAGSWYPGSASRLRKELETYLAAVPPLASPGRLVGLISPHAGLMYSGPVAAHGYALLRGKEDLVAVLVGPSHRVPFEGLAVYARGAFETPLGRVEVDEAVAGRLLSAHPFMVDLPQPHRGEHSLEMQLPFLQHLVKGLRIVPVLMGHQKEDEVRALVAGLVEAATARTDVILVASSDLSHYHPASVANELDALVVGDVRSLDASGLMARLRRSPGHACGGGPMVSVMQAARSLGATDALVLKYADSGDVGDHDKSRVVGYLSAALFAA
jgi:AmmeMemoRadiSam system protein B